MTPLPPVLLPPVLLPPMLLNPWLLLLASPAGPLHSQPLPLPGSSDRLQAALLTQRLQRQATGLLTPHNSLQHYRYPRGMQRRLAVPSSTKHDNKVNGNSTDYFARDSWKQCCEKGPGYLRAMQVLPLSAHSCFQHPGCLLKRILPPLTPPLRMRMMLMMVTLPTPTSQTTVLATAHLRMQLLQAAAALAIQAIDTPATSNAWDRQARMS